MKNVYSIVLICVLYLIFPATAEAHGGRLDKNGGHNCNVAPCTGTYHYHWDGDTSVNHASPQPVAAPVPTPAPAPSSQSPNPTPVASPVVTQPATPASPVVAYAEVSERIDIDYDTIRKDSDTLEIGKTNVVQAGKKGVRTVVYKVTKHDGKEVSRVKLSDAVTQEPQDEVVHIGTKKKQQPEQAKKQTNAHVREDDQSGQSDDSQNSPYGAIGAVALAAGGAYYVWRKMRS